jgi:hypothetical protein
VALVAGDIAVDAQDREILREASPALSRAQAKDGEAGTPFIAAVNDVHDALAAEGNVAALIEAEVVHVAVGVMGVGWDGVGGVDAVCWRCLW